MEPYPIHDKTAIVGIGWTPFTRKSGTTAANLAAKASLMAIQDAGLKVDEVDGVVSFYHRRMDTIPPEDLIELLGIKELNFSLFNDGGGHWVGGAVMSAALMVHSGMCKNVLVYRARNSYSESRHKRAQRANEVTGEREFSTPFGNHHAAASFGHHATAHMARYGTTSLDFAHLAVTTRKHASLNQKAMMRQPITIEDHQNSRMIIYPYRLLDCCQETDGGVALVVTSAERARDLSHNPVYIMAGVVGRGQTADLWETYGVTSGPLLFQRAGITPKDVDVAEIYDPFTFMCMTHLEDYGFVPKGEIGPWIREGRNGLDAELPVNTHGGLLSEAHVHALNHVVEAVQQLRQEGVVDDLCQGPHTYDRTVCRQVRDPEIAFVCGEASGSAILLRK